MFERYRIIKSATKDQARQATWEALLESKSEIMSATPLNVVEKYGVVYPFTAGMAYILGGGGDLITGGDHESATAVGIGLTVAMLGMFRYMDAIQRGQRYMEEGKWLKARLAKVDAVVSTTTAFAAFYGGLGRRIGNVPGAFVGGGVGFVSGLGGGIISTKKDLPIALARDILVNRAKAQHADIPRQQSFPQNFQFA